MNTFIIAEAGANHNRNIEQAFNLVNVARESRATAIKFQTYSSETLYSKNTPDFAGYKDINKLIKSIELPREWQLDIKQYCDEVGIEFMSTPFDEKAVDELISIGVKRLKISGFESTDFRFVDMVASSKLPLIISLGIGFKIQWIDTILDITSKYGNNLTLLHCNNAYPTPMYDADLNMISLLKGYGNFNVGYSDHTMSVFTPSFAVILGANCIEKHFTLSRRLPGPDHPFALEPGELSEMVNLIEDAEFTLLKQTGEYSDSEKNFIKARRSVVARMPIKRGDILTPYNITTKRPYLEGNIPAHEYNNILGSISHFDFNIDDFIKV